MRDRLLVTVCELTFLTTGGHCGSGTSPNQCDTLSALDQWVEKGVARTR